jgi:hypothetical protein
MEVAEAMPMITFVFWPLLKNIGPPESPAAIRPKFLGSFAEEKSVQRHQRLIGLPAQNPREPLLRCPPYPDA